MITVRDSETLHPGNPEPTTIPVAPPRPSEPLVPAEPFQDPNEAPRTLPAPSPNVCPYSPPTEPEDCLALRSFSPFNYDVVS